MVDFATFSYSCRACAEVSDFDEPVAALAGGVILCRVTSAMVTTSAAFGNLDLRMISLSLQRSWYDLLYSAFEVAADPLVDRARPLRL